MAQFHRYRSAADMAIPGITSSWAGTMICHPERWKQPAHTTTAGKAKGWRRQQRSYIDYLCSILRLVSISQLRRSLLDHLSLLSHAPPRSLRLSNIPSANDVAFWTDTVPSATDIILTRGPPSGHLDGVIIPNEGGGESAAAGQ